jgi:hypothetical protein
MEQICQASGEINASIMKDFLEGNGIHSTCGPAGTNAYNGSAGSGQAYLVFVMNEKKEEALKLLKEEGLIKN